MSREDEQSQPVESISLVLLDWLDSDDWELNQLARWLQGYDLPALGGDEEPYVWLLHGLPLGGDRHLRETQLADRTAQFLAEKPDVLRPGDMPEKLIYNLLYLCSGLSTPEQLAEPLFTMYERGTLEGRWRGVELYDALLSALVPNQADDRLRAVWVRMLEGDEPEPLRGNAYDAFEGILWMPQSRLTCGEPDLEAIGHALWVMSRHLDDSPHCRSEFTSLLDKVQEVYFDHTTWSTDLLNLANKYTWATWAVECLPDLSIVVGDVEPEGRRTENGETEDWKRVIVWRPFMKVLEVGASVANFLYKTERSFCNNQVFQVILSQKESQFITGLASFVEPNRINNPYPSPSSVAGNVADAMSAYGSNAGLDALRVKVLKLAHKDILEEV